MRELYNSFIYDIKKNPFRWYFIISMISTVAFCSLFNHGDIHLFHRWALCIWDVIFQGNIRNYFEHTSHFEWMGNPYSVLIYIPLAIWNFPVWLLHTIDENINLATPVFWVWSKLFQVVCTYVTAVYIRRILKFFYVDSYWKDLAVILCFGATSVMISIGEAGQDEMFYVMLFTMGIYYLLMENIKLSYACIAFSIVCAPFMILPSLVMVLIKRLNIFSFLAVVMAFLCGDKLFSYWWGYASRSNSNISIDGGFKQYFSWFFERFTINTPYGIISVFAIAIILILMTCYLFPQKEKDQQNRAIITYTATVLLLITIICWQHAYRFCICTPIIICALFIVSAEKKDFIASCTLIFLLELTRAIVVVTTSISWLFRFGESPFPFIKNQFIGQTEAISTYIGNQYINILNLSAVYAVSVFIIFYILRRNRTTTECFIPLKWVLISYISVPFVIIALYFGTFWYATNNIIYKNNLNYVPNQSAACNIGRNHNCAKEFKLTKATKNLDISVRTITWQNKYENSHMIVSLRKDNIEGELIREEKFSTADMLDQSIYGFTLSNLDLSKGKYVISFTSDEEKQPIALATDHNQAGKQYICDGNIIENEDLKILIKK